MVYSIFQLLRLLVEARPFLLGHADGALGTEPIPGLYHAQLLDDKLGILTILWSHLGAANRQESFDL